MQKEFIIVLTATGPRESAQKIAYELVERRLAACVNIVPAVESVYCWKGKIESAQELLLVIKTVKEKYAAVKDAILELHPYDLPECVMVPIEQGSAEYLAWLSESVG